MKELIMNPQFNINEQQIVNIFNMMGIDLGNCDQNQTIQYNKFLENMRKEFKLAN